MERRLLKDFQIGMVEGIVKDAISSEKEPKDVFSKIARAIGRRTSRESQKKDWNAMVRRSTIARDPIGSTSEAAVRRSRQSLRRYILENQGEALTSMDPERLLEYNPKLSLVSPAARVAYAKFKMSKIKQEYDSKEASGDPDGVSQPGDAAKDTPKATPKGTTSQPTSQPGSKASSIVRPRPKSSLPQPSSVVGSLKKDSPKPESVTVDIEPPPASAATTPAPSPVPSTSKASSDSTTPAAAPSPAPAAAAAPATPAAAATASDATSAGNTSAAASTPAAPEKDTLGKASSVKQDFRARTPIPEEDEDSKSRPQTPAVPKDSDKKDDEPPTRPIGPTKPGGRSKISGQVLTGWL